MWNGKKKAVTFSFDDGVTQDIRLIEIFNKYGLKGTFNFIKRHYGVINTVCGALLCVIGVLMMTGLFDSVIRLLS